MIRSKEEEHQQQLRQKMSLTEDNSQGTERHVQQDGDEHTKMTDVNKMDENKMDENKTDQNNTDQKNTDQKNTDQKNTDQKRTSTALTLLREDLSQFKAEVLKVLKDKDTKVDKDSPDALSLLRDDLSQFKEDMSSIFNIRDVKSTDPTTSQAAERTLRHLSLIKEDISNVFRLSPLKDKGDQGHSMKEDSSKIKVPAVERMDEAFLKLFRREQRQLRTAEDSQGGTVTPSEMNQEKTDEGLSQKLSEKNANSTMTDRTNGQEDKDDGEESEKKEESGETASPSNSGETMCPSQAVDHRPDSNEDSVASEENEEVKMEEEEEEESSETLEFENLLSELRIMSMRKQPGGGGGGEGGGGGGDLWSVKNFACYLTFDPNTANAELHLSDLNRKATRLWASKRCLDHLDRFKSCPQVLCREGLLDQVYWEVEWSGGADIGVTYNSISRDGDTVDCLLGHNKLSWSLECSEGSYTPSHNNKRFRSTTPEPFSHRVGVFLDWSAGSLSFYCVSRDAMVLLHSFTSTFTEPLYPGFWVWTYDGSVSLCQVELDWERLLK